MRGAAKCKNRTPQAGLPRLAVPFTPGAGIMKAKLRRLQKEESTESELQKGFIRHATDRMEENQRQVTASSQNNVSFKCIRSNSPTYAQLAEALEEGHRK